MKTCAAIFLTLTLLLPLDRISAQSLNKFQVLAANFKTSAEPALAQDQIVIQLGSPIYKKEAQILRQDTWYYQEGEVEFTDGVVTRLLSYKLTAAEVKNNSAERNPDQTSQSTLKKSANYSNEPSTRDIREIVEEVARYFPDGTPAATTGAATLSNTQPPIFSNINPNNMPNMAGFPTLPGMPGMSRPLEDNDVQTDLNDDEDP